MDAADIRREIRNLPDIFPVRFDKTAAVPMTLPVDVEMGPQVDDDPDDPDIGDIRRDVQKLSDVFPVRFDKSATLPMTLPVHVDMGPQVDDDPDVMLTGRDVEVSDTDVGRDIRVLTDGCPIMFEESATVLLSLPVVVNTEPQGDVRWETTSAAVPFVDGCGRLAGWHSHVRMDSEDALLVLHDERSVMTFLVRPVAVLISQFFLSSDDCGDDRFSPGASDRVSLDLSCGP